LALRQGVGNRYLEQALLEQLFHDLNRDHFRGELPLPKLGWNSRLSSTAGRFCTGSRNPIFPRPPVIEVASYLRDVPEGEMHVRDTVLHEMIHYYLWFKRRPHGHTPEFSQILKTVAPNATTPCQKSVNGSTGMSARSARKVSTHAAS
jgi:predicted SprT family Zn-dependent metalloprotease